MCSTGASLHSRHSKLVKSFFINLKNVTDCHLFEWRKPKQKWKLLMRLFSSWAAPRIPSPSVSARPNAKCWESLTIS
jgi:hypothetical protein